MLGKLACSTVWCDRDNVCWRNDKCRASESWIKLGHKDVWINGYQRGLQKQLKKHLYSKIGPNGQQWQLMASHWWKMTDNWPKLTKMNKSKQMDKVADNYEKGDNTRKNDWIWRAEQVFLFEIFSKFFSTSLRNTTKYCKLYCIAVCFQCAYLHKPGACASPQTYHLSSCPNGPSEQLCTRTIAQLHTQTKFLSKVEVHGMSFAPNRSKHTVLMRQLLEGSHVLSGCGNTRSGSVAVKVFEFPSSVLGHQTIPWLQASWSSASCGDFQEKSVCALIQGQVKLQRVRLST